MFMGLLIRPHKWFNEERGFGLPCTQTLLVWSLMETCDYWFSSWSAIQENKQYIFYSSTECIMRDFQWYLWFKHDLRQKYYICTPSSTQPGFELMTSRSWEHISCHWDACSNHLAISDFTHTYFAWVKNCYSGFKIHFWFQAMFKVPTGTQLNKF